MKKTDHKRLEYSVLVLLEEHSEGFAEYVNGLQETFLGIEASFEIIILANGTRKFLDSQLDLISTKGSDIRALIFNKKTTQAVCLKAGIRDSHGQIIVACGSYNQITEQSFLNLISALDENTDIICPWRQNRIDPRINQVQSRAFNWVARKLLNTKLNDLNSSVRVFHKTVLDDIPLYGNMYRFFPILAEGMGYTIKELKCEHYEERGDTGIYSLSEYVTRAIDIITIYFNTKFNRKPLRFFLFLGTLFMAIGLSICAYIFLERFLFDIQIGNRYSLLYGFFIITMGVQIGSMGLLGEIISFSLGRNKKDYKVERLVNIESDNNI